MTDKKKLQERFRKTLNKATRLDAVPKPRIDDLQNYKKNNQKSPNYKGSASVIDKGKFKTHLGSEKNTTYKQNKSSSHEFNKKLLHHKGLVLPVAIKNTTDNYGRLDEQKESDENSAVLATEEGVSLVKKVVGRANRTKQPKLKFEASQDKLNVLFKPEETKQKLSYFKQIGSNGNIKKTKISQQKRSIKKHYVNGRQSAFNTGIKDRLKNVLMQVKERVTKGLKKFAIYMVGPMFIFIVTSLLTLAMVQAFTGAVSSIVSTSYQSSDLVVTGTDVLYTRLEADLLYAINHIESSHSGYDEYQYDVDAIGHNPQIIAAYLTAKFGEFTIADISNELSRIFDLNYTYRLVSKVETRHRTVTNTTINPVTGAIIITTSEEEYDWHLLKTNLTTTDLNQILMSQLNVEERDFYSSLLSTSGNFIRFPSPIKEEWKDSLSSPFGYRLDPISNEVTFHAGIDIAKPTGTELVTIIAGKVIQTGYDANGYGNFIIVEENNSKQTVLYAHCHSLLARTDDEVKVGQVIATIGSTGKSTGPHVHLEIRDSKGNKLNPYFYLSSEIAKAD